MKFQNQEFQQLFYLTVIFYFTISNIEYITKSTYMHKDPINELVPHEHLIQQICVSNYSLTIYLLNENKDKE